MAWCVTLPEKGGKAVKSRRISSRTGECSAASSACGLSKATLLRCSWRSRRPGRKATASSGLQISSSRSHRAVVEQRWLTPQGVRWFSWEETAMCDDAGVILAVRAVGRDITRQRLAEEQFYRLSRAVEQSPVSIVITDLDGRAQYVNAKFIAMSGHTLEDILDRRLEVLRDGHPDEVSYQNFWQTIRSGGEWRGELSTTRSDGSVVWESVKVSCLRSPTGEITNFLCLREDITERKRLEAELRQAQKMESLGTLDRPRFQQPADADHRQLRNAAGARARR